MARLTMAQRRALPKSAFLVPSKAPGPGSFPVPDVGHRRSAVGLSAAGPNRPARPGVYAKAVKSLTSALRKKGGK